MKVIFLDNDGVICLSSNWGTRHKKQKKWDARKLSMTSREIPIEYRFDNFDKKAIKILNEILEETGAEIVVSSDWRQHAKLDELGVYYLEQGIIKAPVGITNRNLAECDVPNNFVWSREWDLEQCRSLEIKQYLKDNPQITHWVAIDDLNMGKTGLDYSMEFEHAWGLENFVHTPRKNEGIKQSGIKEKILEYLK
jgi:hypothetical protein